MCGIAGIHRRNDNPEGDLAKMSAALLRGIENRGHDATGVLCQFDDGDQWLRRDTVTAKKFLRKGRSYARAARTTLLHTRFATKGSPWDVRNAHPLTDKSGNVHVVHNGVLYNDDEVFLTFGLDRVTDTDTEAIPALIELVGWDKAGDALALIDGSMAIAAVDARRPKELLLARSDSSPLHYVVTRDLVVWASSDHAIVQGFKAAGLAVPSKKSIHYMPMMHLLRVNGKVGELERFAEDPKPWSGGGYYTTYRWDWDDEDDYDEHWDEKLKKWVKDKLPGQKAGGWKAESDPTYQKSLPPATQSELPAVRTSVQVEPFPEHSVYEDIAIDVLISEGYTTDEAIDAVAKDGWEVAGLSLEELDIVDDEWDDEGDYKWEDDEVVPHGNLVAPIGITLIGDVAMAALQRRKKAEAGLDSDYLSSLDR